MFRDLYFNSLTPTILDLSHLYSLTEDVYKKSKDSQEIRFSFQSLALLSSSNGCLYDSSTGILISDSASCRMTRCQRMPSVSDHHIQIGKPAEGFDWMHTALVIPKIQSTMNKVIIPELMAYMWPFLVDHGLLGVEGSPVIVQGNIQEPIASSLFNIWRECGTFPVFYEHLPPYTLIKRAVIPRPSMQFLAAASPLYFKTCANFASLHFEDEHKSNTTRDNEDLIYVFDSKSDISKTSEHCEMALVLRNYGWTLADTQALTFNSRIALFKKARIIAGHYCPAMLELAFLAGEDPLPRIIALGGLPNLDLILTLKGMNISGLWIRSISQSIQSPENQWLISASEVAKMIHKFSGKL